MIVGGMPDSLPNPAGRNPVGPASRGRTRRAVRNRRTAPRSPNRAYPAAVRLMARRRRQGLRPQATAGDERLDGLGRATRLERLPELRHLRFQDLDQLSVGFVESGVLRPATDQ